MQKFNKNVKTKYQSTTLQVGKSASLKSLLCHLKKFSITTLDYQMVQVRFKTCHLFWCAYFVQYMNRLGHYDKDSST